MALTQVDQGLLGSNAQYTGFKNRLINSAMVIDQRNAGASVTITTSAEFGVDRWRCQAGANNKLTLQQNAGSVTPPVGFTNYLGATSSSAYTVGSTESFSIAQYIEGFNTADLQWGTANASTVTLSFWVRSSLTGTFSGALANSAVNRSYPFSYTISSANTWEYKTITIAGDTSGTWVGATNGVGIRIWINLGAGSTLSTTGGAWAAGDYRATTGSVSVVGTNGATFYITGVQLEKGSTATSFDYRPYGTELALCQRYYYQRNFVSTGSDAAATLQCYNSSGAYGKFFDLPVTMRATPTGSLSSVTHFRPSTSNGSNSGAFSSGSVDYLSPTMVGTQNFSGSSGLSAGNATTITANTTSAWIAASAEL